MKVKDVTKDIRTGQQSKYPILDEVRHLFTLHLLTKFVAEKIIKKFHPV